MYTDERRATTYEQEADVFILACGAVETARLLLLSRSRRFPNGLANGSDLVGRNVTFHEYSAAVGTFDDPIYAWAGGGYVSASSFEFYEHDESRGFVGGGHIACAGVGIPLPINWSLPDRPTWGAGAKQVDRDYFNHSMAVAMVVHDLPQHDNRVELDDTVTDAWGLPVARITLIAARERSGDGPLSSSTGTPRSWRRPARPRSRRSTSTGSPATARTSTARPEWATTRIRSVLDRWCRSPRGRQPLRGGRRPVPDRNRRQPHADDHGQRVAGRGAHCRRSRRRNVVGRRLRQEEGSRQARPPS